MRYVTVECPRCGAAHQYLLDAAAERHLRRCPDCAGWFVRDEGRGRVASLGEPPICPVDGCDETLAADELPVHVIERHDASLVP